MLLKRELPFEEVPRLWEACWGAPTGLLNVSADVQISTSGGNGGRGSNDRILAVSEDFTLYCCAAILQRKEKELIASSSSLESIFQHLRGVRSHADELVRLATRLARADVARQQMDDK